MSVAARLEDRPVDVIRFKQKSEAFFFFFDLKKMFIFLFLRESTGGES